MSAQVLGFGTNGVGRLDGERLIHGLDHAVATLGTIGGFLEGVTNNPLMGLKLNSTAGVALVLGRSLVAMVQGVLTQLGLMLKNNETINNIIRNIAPPTA